MRLLLRSVAPVLAVAAAIFLSCSTARALTVNVPAGGNIQSAIDQVNAAGGGTVNLAAGSWTISTSIQMKSNVTLDGAGTPATTLNAGADIQVIQEASDGLSNITVENMKINGRGSTGSTNCQGIYIASLSTYHQNVNIINVQCLNFGGMGCHLKRVNNSSVSNCNFHDNGATNLFHNLYIRQSTNTTVSGCQLVNSPVGSGFHLAGTCDHVTIQTCNCTGNGQDGMDIMDTLTNILVTNNTCNNNRNVDGTGGEGIMIWNGSGSCTNNSASGNAVANYKIASTWTQSGNH